MIAPPDRFRVARGRRPGFHADAGVDRLFFMMTALMQEVAVLRDRLDAHERLLAEPGRFGPAEVDAFAPDADAFAARQAERRRLIGNVLRVVAEPEPDAAQDPATFADAIEEA